MAEPQRFRASIYKVGMNYCVDVPAEVGACLGRTDEDARALNVRGHCAGVAFRSRLTPRGGGRWRLFLNGEVRGAAGAGKGDTVEVELAGDDEPREASIPADLRSALEGVEGGVDGFTALTEAQRTGMVTFLDRARTPETRAKYVRQIVDEVRKRRERS